MNKKVIRYAVLGIGVYVFFAAAVMLFYKDDPQSMHWDDREAYNKRYIEKLKADNSLMLEDVLSKIGSPDLTFAKLVDDDQYQVAYYRTQHQHSDGITTKDECTGLLFKNNKLIAWGPEAWEAYESAEQ